MFRDGLRVDGVDARVTGSFAPGDALTFDGTNIVSGAASGGSHFATATVDFGASFTDSASATVTGQTWVTSSSSIQAWLQDDSTADSTADEHTLLGQDGKLVVTDRVVGTGFTINMWLEGTLAKGQFTVHWEAV
jgi:hypothetical protein